MMTSSINTICAQIVLFSLFNTVTLLPITNFTGSNNVSMDTKALAATAILTEHNLNSSLLPLDSAGRIGESPNRLVARARDQGDAGWQMGSSHSNRNPAPRRPNINNNMDHNVNINSGDHQYVSRQSNNTKHHQNSFNFQNQPNLHAVDRVYEGSGNGPPKQDKNHKKERFDDTEESEDDEDEDDDYDDKEPLNIGSGIGNIAQQGKDIEPVQSNITKNPVTKSPDENPYLPFRPPLTTVSHVATNASRINLQTASPPSISSLTSTQRSQGISSMTTDSTMVTRPSQTTETPKLQMNSSKPDSIYDYEEENDDEESEDSAAFEDNDSDDTSPIRNTTISNLTASSQTSSRPTQFPILDKIDQHQNLTTIESITNAATHAPIEQSIGYTTQSTTMAPVQLYGITSSTKIPGSILNETRTPIIDMHDEDDEEDEEEDEEEEEEEDFGASDDGADDYGDTISNQPVSNSKFPVPSHQYNSSTIDNKPAIPTIDEMNSPRQKESGPRIQQANFSVDSVAPTLPKQIAIPPNQSTQNPVPPYIPKTTTTSVPISTYTTATAVPITTMFPKTSPKPPTTSVITTSSPIAQTQPNWVASSTPARWIPPLSHFSPTTPSPFFPNNYPTPKMVAPPSTRSHDIDESLTRQLYDKALEVYQELDKTVRSTLEFVWPANLELNSNTFEPLMAQPMFFMLALAGAVIGLVLTMMLVVYLITYQIQPKDDDISLY